MNSIPPTPMDDPELLARAAEARARAYAPYSGFAVGAALATPDGRIFTGCNIENASYGLTICAERSALCKAVSDGHRRFSKLALSAARGGTPCGACRQVLHEFAPDLPILLGDETGVLVEEVTLAALLPRPFGPESLRSGA